MDTKFFYVLGMLLSMNFLIAQNNVRSNESLPLIEQKHSFKQNKSLQMLAYQTNQSKDSLYIFNTNSNEILKYHQVKQYEPFQLGFVLFIEDKLWYISIENNKQLIASDVDSFYVLNEEKLLYTRKNEIHLYDNNEKLKLASDNKKIWVSNVNYIIYQSQNSELLLFDMHTNATLLLSNHCNAIHFIKYNSNKDIDIIVASFKENLSHDNRTIAVKKEGFHSWKIFDIRLPEKNYNIINHNLFIEPDHHSIYHIEYEFKNPKDSLYEYKNQDTHYGQKFKTNIRKWYLNNKYSNISSTILEQNEFPTINNDLSLILDYNPYELRSTQGIQKVDVYLKNKNNNLIPIIKEITLGNESIYINNQQNVLVFYKENQWWSVNLKDLKIKNLTEHIPAEFSKKVKRYFSEPDHYGFVGWSKNKKGFYVNDRRDVWFIELDKIKTRKITNSTHETISRIYIDEGKPNEIYSSIHLNAKEIEDSDSVFIIETHENTQYNSILEFNGGILKAKTEFLPKRFYALKKYNNIFSYIEESASVAPQIVISKINQNNSKEQYTFPLYNARQDYLPKVKRIAFQTDDGTWLRGSLHYPLNWKNDEFYPIIFNIYELGKHHSNIFIKPKFDNYDGFNKSLATMEGYFVFYPDLRYERNNTTKYLITDLQYYLEFLENFEPTINTKSNGIIGHSFGGYEVLDVISRSNLFKVAVAGAGISSLYEVYYNPNIFGNSNMFKFENVQHDSDPLYINKDLLKYDPLTNVNKINTPLLLWTGDKDERVNYINSEMMYWALWRQNKVVEYYKFKNERHTLTKLENQINLTKILLNFFDSYLKNKEAI